MDNMTSSIPQNPPNDWPSFSEIPADPAQIPQPPSTQVNGWKWEYFNCTRATWEWLDSSMGTAKKVAAFIPWLIVCFIVAIVETFLKSPVVCVHNWWYKPKQETPPANTPTPATPNQTPPVPPASQTTPTTPATPNQTPAVPPASQTTPANPATPNQTPPVPPASQTTPANPATPNPTPAVPPASQTTPPNPVRPNSTQQQTPFLQNNASVDYRQQNRAEIERIIPSPERVTAFLQQRRGAPVTSQNETNTAPPSMGIRAQLRNSSPTDSSNDSALPTDILDNSSPTFTPTPTSFTPTPNGANSSSSLAQLDNSNQTPSNYFFTNEDLLLGATCAISIPIILAASNAALPAIGSGLAHYSSLVGGTILSHLPSSNALVSSAFSYLPSPPSVSTVASAAFSYLPSPPSVSTVASAAFSYLPSPPSVSTVASAAFSYLPSPPSISTVASAAFSYLPSVSTVASTAFSSFSSAIRFLSSF